MDQGPAFLIIKIQTQIKALKIILEDACWNFSNINEASSQIGKKSEDMLLLLQVCFSVKLSFILSPGHEKPCAAEADEVK